MPTYLETLAATERAREQQAAIHLAREERVLEALETENRVREQLFEQADDWASSDPHYTGRMGAALGSSAADLYQAGAYAYHSARPGSRRDGAYPPFYRTEIQHWQMVDAARTLEAFCPTATNILNILQFLVVHTGFTYNVKSRKRGKNEQLVEKGQAMIDKWMKQEHWFEIENETYRRIIRDGEVFLLTEPDDISPLPHVRFVEPEQIREPLDAQAQKRKLSVSEDSSWRFGILTSKEDTSIDRGYWVLSHFAEKEYRGSFYTDQEVFHIKSQGTDRQAKRGVTEFHPVLNDVPGTRKLLRALREGAQVQASIAGVREHPGGTMPDRMGSNSNPANVTRSGLQQTSMRLDGPTLLDTSAGMKYIGSPLAAGGKVDVLIKILEASLRNLGSRWQMPEGLVSGNASATSLASALVAEGPFVRSLQARQHYIKCAYGEFMERILDYAAVIGLLGRARENVLDELEITVECPIVVARKYHEETYRSRVLHERGVLSSQTWADREGLDYEDEQEGRQQAPPPAPGMPAPDSAIAPAAVEPVGAGATSSMPPTAAPGAGSERIA